MADVTADCEALFCCGMGVGAYESMKVVGIRLVVTDIAVIDEAVEAYIEGDIVEQI
jgi:predicted Fe-Mo cluster-binding NifX family protein